MFKGPPVHLICPKELSFPYVPGHLSHIVFELVKNSLRAVVERFGTQDEARLPPIKVVVVEGKEDITIKISDEGGGIPRSAIPLIWTYMYTTMDLGEHGAEENLRDSDFKAPMAGFGYGLPLSRLVRPLHSPADRLPVCLIDVFSSMRDTLAVTSNSSPWRAMVRTYIFTSIGCRAARNPFHIKFIISRLEFVHHSCRYPTTHFAVHCLYYLEFYSFLSRLRSMAAEFDARQTRCGIQIQLETYKYMIKSPCIISQARGNNEMAVIQAETKAALERRDVKSPISVRSLSF